MTCINTFLSGDSLPSFRSSFTVATRLPCCSGLIYKRAISFPNVVFIGNFPTLRQAENMAAEKSVCECVQLALISPYCLWWMTRTRPPCTVKRINETTCSVPTYIALWWRRWAAWNDLQKKKQKGYDLGQVCILNTHKLHGIYLQVKSDTTPLTKHSSKFTFHK